MVELWVILSLVAALLWTVTSLINKFVLSKEMQDPILATIIGGFIISMLFIISSIVVERNILIPSYLIFIAFLAGIFYVISAYFYYSAMQKGEVSRVASFISLSPIFVLIFAFILLDERLTILNYAGIMLIVLGSFLISIKKDHSKYILSKVFLIAILSALFSAFRELLVKFVTIQVSFWSVIFWLGLGVLVSSIFLFSLHHPYVRKKSKKGIKHFILGRALSGASFIAFFMAISMTSVSLVSAFVRIEIFFIFIAATILSYFHPKIIREKINPLIFFQKLISIIFILIGAYLLI
jgi:drug/metabolite transporter (DMT)-like permease